MLVSSERVKMQKTEKSTFRALDAATVAVFAEFPVGTSAVC